MAPLSKLLAIAAGGTFVAGHKRERSEFVAAVQSGSVPKSQVELVLAQHDEDLSWSEPFKAVRTVYCKGSSCDAGALKLPNVGREGHTFLHHIVENYENLADWTVFSQAEKPSEGYFGHGHGGGHLLTGSSIEDFLAHNDETEGKDDSLFLMTSKVHLPTMAHSLRSAFKTGRDMLAPSMTAKAMCPKDVGDSQHEDVWGEFQAVPKVRNFLQRKCGFDDAALPAALQAFWEDFVQLPMPANKVVHYAQGARFAVSRNRLQQRSKDFYKSLLGMVAEEQDPCLNYLFEWSWYYILGHPSTAPCANTARDVKVDTADVHMMARMLQEGVSGGEPGEPGEPGTEVMEATEITGTITFEMDSAMASDFVDNDTNVMAVEESIGRSTQVPTEFVKAMLSVVTASGGRRLEDMADIMADYTITIPSDSPINPTDVVAAIANDDFMEEMEEHLAMTTGLNLTVSEVTTPEAKVIGTSTTAQVASGAVDCRMGMAAELVLMALGVAAFRL